MTAFQNYYLNFMIEQFEMIWAYHLITSLTAQFTIAKCLCVEGLN